MDVTTISEDAAEPGGVANSVYKGSPDEAGFDRWDSDSPDVKANDEAAFSAALAQSTAFQTALQHDAAAFQDNGQGMVGSYTQTVVD